MTGASALELVTIAIPARNEEGYIAACLDSVLAQSYHPLEIIVVDGNSTDHTRAVVSEYATRHPNVRLLENPRAIVPVSLNIAAQAATGTWFVRIDAHATVGPDYVERAIAWLRTGKWGGVGGRVDPVALTPAGRAVAAAMSSRFGIGNSVHHYGKEPVAADHVPFPAYPTALIATIGGWDERLVTNQDFEFDYRLGLAGHQLLYDPSLAITYVGQQSIRGVFRQFRRYGRGKARVVMLHPRSMRARHLVAPALVAWLLGGAGIALRRPLIGAASAGPYLAGVAAATVVLSREVREPAARLRLPAALVAMHVGWGLGFWEGLAQEVRRPEVRRLPTSRDRRRPGDEPPGATAG